MRKFVTECVFFFWYFRMRDREMARQQAMVAGGSSGGGGAGGVVPGHVLQCKYPPKLHPPQICRYELRWLILYLKKIYCSSD